MNSLLTLFDSLRCLLQQGDETLQYRRGALRHPGKGDFQVALRRKIGERNERHALGLRVAGCFGDERNTQPTGDELEQRVGLRRSLGDIRDNAGIVKDFFDCRRKTRAFRVGEGYEGILAEIRQANALFARKRPSRRHRDDEPRTLNDAERGTSLSDWGEPDLKEGLSILLKSLNEDVKFSDFGRRAFLSRFHMHLCNRLRLAEDRKRLPGIAQERIDKPIFITGLPRSGSSFLLEVMAHDPTNRVPRTWEILQPSPPPDRATYDSDPRIEVAQRLLEEQGFTDPDLLATHPFGATLPEECAFIVEQSFVAGNYSGFVNATQYAEWLATKADHGIAYAFHRCFLQHLQSHYRAERWALKAPAHMFYLHTLLNEYPDARVIITHRDLMKVLPSIASMATALNRIFSDPATVDPIAIGRKVVHLLVDGVRHTMETRDRLAKPHQFCDVLYADLRSHPVETVERIYAHFEIPFSDEAREAMTATSRTKARHGMATGGTATP